LLVTAGVGTIAFSPPPQIKERELFFFFRFFVFTRLDKGEFATALHQKKREKCKGSFFR